MPAYVRGSEFRKHFNILSEKLKRKVIERLEIFVVDEFNSVLNNHPLHGEYAGCRSINITGDLRVVYKKVAADTVLLLAIGTHHQLFGK